jgi:hypothetical protein
MCAESAVKAMRERQCGGSREQWPGKNAGIAKKGVFPHHKSPVFMRVPVMSLTAKHTADNGTLYSELQSSTNPAQTFVKSRL